MFWVIIILIVIAIGFSMQNNQELFAPVQLTTSGVVPPECTNQCTMASKYQAFPSLSKCLRLDGMAQKSVTTEAQSIQDRSKLVDPWLKQSKTDFNPLASNEYDPLHPTHFVSERRNAWHDKLGKDNLSYFFSKK